MTGLLKLTSDEINKWADDPQGPVALEAEASPGRGGGRSYLPADLCRRRLQHRRSL